jgi:N-acyl-D-aspartate/D-glutamate deacylase
MDNPLLTIDEFITRSSGQTAKILGLSDRGVLKQGLAADILIWQQEDYKANANFKNWNVLSSGINDLWVNGTRVIEAGNYNRTLAGKFVSK